jgi:hypothetical protein
MCHFFWIFCALAHFWSYANTIETAVLLVIVYDIVWHRLNAIREIKREEEAETREIEREKLAEERQIRRERQEILRKQWQELQSSLISLSRLGSLVVQFRQFVEKNNNSQDPTTRQLLLTLTNRYPIVLSDLGDYWGRAVALLNVFPEPRDTLALEVLEVIQELGKSVGDSSIEIKDATLKTLAELARRVSDPATLPNGRG